MPNQHRADTPTELAWLSAHYATAPQADILAAVPGRSWTNIQNQASKIGATGREKFVPKLAVSSWHPENVALLLAHYPLGGSAAVAQLTGLTQVAVRAEASRRKLGYVCKKDRPKPPKAAKPKKRKAVKRKPAPKVAAPPKPVKAVPLLAVKRSAATPNLNLAKEARKRREEAPKRAAAITADEVRKLPYHHGGRMAYMLHGQAGWQQWKQQQPG